jgi:carboxypeptidase family protein/uncharacterized protein DUF3520
VPLLSLRFVILLIGMLAAPTTLTIVETGSIAGHVRDPKGGPVKGARVVVIATALTAATDDSGAYLIANVPVGTYTVRAMMIGYTAAEAKGVRVTANSAVTVDLTLAQGAMALEAIVVKGYSANSTMLRGATAAGGAGIRRAYDEAVANLIRGGNNRVILATDGDFNVGPSSDAEMVQLIEEKRRTGVFLTVLGVGEGNLQAAKMEKLADKGNGNYAYLDNIAEAQKVLVHELGGTLYTVAKDVKIQVEWNPARVRACRLIGYENRMLARKDGAH